MAERLYQPLQLGNVTLKHKMVMAPLTRFVSHVKSFQDEGS